MKKSIAIAAVAASLLFAGAASAANLVQNGDFQTPIANPAAPGFDTDYAFRSGSSNQYGNPNSMYDEGTWTVGSNPHDVHDLWINQSFSNMLILNGKVSGLPSTAWSQAFVVAAGDYDYAFDVLNIYGGPGASNLTFDFSMNGGAFQTLQTVTTSNDGSDAGVVVHRSGTLHSDGGLLRISLRNSSGLAGGNDFGVDNISLSSVAVPEPATWLMMILGFGGMGAVLRRRRQAAFAA